MKLVVCSPLYFIDEVKAPTLFLLGKKDLRVPQFQGLAYHHKLKKNGVITK